MPEGAPPVDIHLAIASVQADAARIARYTDRRDRFLDALDWSALDEQTAREAAMLDALHPLAGRTPRQRRNRCSRRSSLLPAPAPLARRVDLAALTLKGSP
jgi:hypothetical protein